jgi:hypothetical protein
MHKEEKEEKGKERKERSPSNHTTESRLMPIPVLTTILNSMSLFYIAFFTKINIRSTLSFIALLLQDVVLDVLVLLRVAYCVLLCYFARLLQQTMNEYPTRNNTQQHSTQQL